ncbi:MAG: hypothetical protein EKK61_04630 [Rickettsiales bacterium]|nr:MAG: hypothetical protein EKK61_04630 [Rickettsiales bacterium]
MKIFSKIILCSYLIFYLVVVSFASEQVQITSEELIINKSDYTAIFEENVLLIFEDMKLSTSKLIIHYSDASNKKEIKKIVIPNRLKAIRSKENEIIVADSGEFDNTSKKLTFTGNVKMKKDDNILLTKKLIYMAKFEKIIKEK